MEGSQSALFSPLLFLGFLLLFMYIVIIRPQNKRNKEINEMLSKLEVGTEVIAASGIIGKVKAIKGEYISIEVSENVVFKLQRSAIANILPKGTHEFKKFIKPSELACYVRNANAELIETKGMFYNPITHKANLNNDLGVNYLMYARKI